MTAASQPRESVRTRRLNHLVRLATNAFAHHQVRSRTETSIVIQHRHEDGKWSGKWSSAYATEIVAGSLAHLIVTGDIDTVVFARQSGSLRARLGWIAPRRQAEGATEGEADAAKYPSGRDADFDYLREKASIGMSCSRKLAEEFVAELAEDLIAELAEDAEAEGDDERACKLRDIDLPNEEHDVRDFLEALGDAGLSDEWEYASWLYMVAPRVVYAWAACRKAAELIDAADAADEAAREAAKAAREVVAGSAPISPTNPGLYTGGEHG